MSLLAACKAKADSLHTGRGCTTHVLLLGGGACRGGVNSNTTGSPSSGMTASSCLIVFAVAYGFICEIVFFEDCCIVLVLECACEVATRLEATFFSDADDFASVALNCVSPRGSPLAAKRKASSVRGIVVLLVEVTSSSSPSDLLAVDGVLLPP